MAGSKFVRIVRAVGAALAFAVAFPAAAQAIVAGAPRGDLGPATSAKLYSPRAVALDAAGNLYISDSNTGRLRRVAAGSGIITTHAGGGIFSTGLGDGGPATSATLNSNDAAIDSAGNVYIADRNNNRVRRVAAGSGIITTVAGTGVGSFSGDGGAATSATINQPTGVALDSAGNLLIADQGNHRIRRVAAGTGVISTIAGTGSATFSGDGGPATAAGLNRPWNVAIDGTGNLYISDEGNNRIRRVDAATQVITTVAGSGIFGSAGDGGAATAAQMNGPRYVAVTSGGDLLIADTFNHKVRRVAGGIITTVAGTGTNGEAGDGGPATSASLHQPNGIAATAAGDIYIADLANHRVRRVLAASGTISTVAGVGISDGAPAALMGLYSPQQIARNAAGDLFVADSFDLRVRRISAATGLASTVAGDGRNGPMTDGIAATSAALAFPVGVAVDSAGHVYVSDLSTSRVRRVDAATGLISTIAGNGTATYAGDGGPATSASLRFPRAIAFDAADNLYIADQSNHRVRRVDRATGSITTVAGNGTTAFTNGVAATGTGINLPSAVILDAAGNLYIAERGGHRVLRVAAGTGLITVIAGTGTAGSTGDGGPATSARITSPAGLAVDGAGNVYVASEVDRRIRRIGANGTITTVMDGSGATALFGPLGVVLDGAGDLLFSDFSSGFIRKQPKDSTLPDTTIAVAPPATTASSRSTFVFTAADTAGAPHAFQCAIDGGPFAACGATSIFELANGAHALQVRAVDGWGNVDPTPATHSWTVRKLPAISSSGRHTLAVDMAGKVYAWGNDSRGQLGQGRAVNRVSPAQVAGLSDITHIAFSAHGLAVDASRRVWSWGTNSCGQLGPRDSTLATRPSRVVGVTNVSAVAAGFCFSLALRTDGTVLGWGTIPGYGDSTAVRVLPELTNIVEIAAGSDHALARRSDGTVYSLGGNGLGQRGLGTTGGTPGVAAQVPGLSGVVAVSAGLSSSAVLLSNGQAHGWGAINNSLTGFNTPQALAASPVPISAIQTSRASGNVYALRSDGTAARHASTGWLTSEFAGYAGLAHIALGSGNIVGIISGGQLVTSGDNRAGQLGLGDTTARTAPTQIPGFANARQVALDLAGVLALRADGTVWHWGEDTAGQSGDGGAVASSVPLAVNLGSANITAVAAGGFTSYALEANGAVWGWGSNLVSVLDGSSVNRATPAPIPGLSNVRQIVAADNILAALTRSGDVYFAGNAGLGSIGTGAVPVLQSNLSGAAMLAAGLGSIYALSGSGSVLAYGRNESGQLGDGTTGFRSSPVAVSGIGGTVVHIAAGGARAGAVTSDGKVWMWGAGPLGNGGTASSATPVQVAGITDAAELAIGSDLVIVRRQNGSLLAWGDLALADAASRDPLVPYPLTFSGGIASIAASAAAPIGHVVDDNGVAWGFGRYGAITSINTALGDGTYVARPAPVVLKAASGAGSVDANDWYLDLDPASPQTVPAAATPKSQAVATLSGANTSLSMDATVKYKSADLGKKVNIYVFGLVPTSFFGLVKASPMLSAPDKLEAKARKNGGFVLAQLTPSGWADVTGQILAHAQSTANAAGSAARILGGINAALIPGARFCLGYGESSGSLLSFQSLSEVLLLEGASANASGVPCVLTGIYVEGPKSTRAGASVTFNASVVGLSPTGSVQFRDGTAPLSTPIAITSANDAVARAELRTSGLAVGKHSISAAYGGDAQNASVAADIPVSLEVVSAAPGASVTTLAGPSSSERGAEVVLVATVAGDSPTGTVQFRSGSGELGAAVPLVGGTATLRTESLPLGTLALTAAYSGDGANAASTSGPLSHTVHPGIATTVTLTTTASSSAVGSAVTFTARVTGANPTGNVVFRDGSRVIATVALVNGSASVTVSDFDAGQHVITAEYTGDGGNTAVTSAGLFQNVGSALALAPGLLDFRDQFVNLPATLQVTVTNPGASAVTVTGVSASAPFGATTDCATLPSGASCKARVTFTATAAGPVLGTLTVSSSAGTHSAAIAANGEVTLVGHYYRSILRRAPDSGGRSFWEAEAARVSGLGANVNETWFAMAMSFYNSSEYVAFGRNPTEYVRDLYNTFFNRNADDAGLNYWVGQMSGGMPREVVLASFMFSTEFTQFAQAIFGNTAARAEVDTVVDFYRGLLGRLPDTSGFNFWVGQFRQAQCQGGSAIYEKVEAISSAYANSPEYAGRNRTNAQYIGDLYNAFLRRGGDLDGVRFWIGQLDSGARTRDQVRRDFMASPEFNARVVAIVNQGCLR